MSRLIQLQNSKRGALLGFTLVELLASLVIVTILFVGVLGLQMDSMQKNQSSYMRTQAVMIASDIANRIRINRAAALAGRYNNVNTDKVIQTSEPNCMTNATGCSPTELARADIYNWALHFRDLGGKSADFSPAFPGGRGEIRQTGDVFTIFVYWKESDWIGVIKGNPTELREQKDKSIFMTLSL